MLIFGARGFVFLSCLFMGLCGAQCLSIWFVWFPTRIRKSGVWGELVSYDDVGFDCVFEKKPGKLSISKKNFRVSIISNSGGDSLSRCWF